MTTNDKTRQTHVFSKALNFPMHLVGWTVIAPNIKVEARRPKMGLICAKSQGHHYVIMRLESFGVIRHFLTLLTGKTQSLGNQLRAQPTDLGITILDKNK